MDRVRLKEQEAAEGREVHVPTRAELLFLVVFSAGPCGVASPQQENGKAQDEARFKTETSLVLLDVTVTDKRGRAVPGFKPDNLVVCEDGSQQDIAFFSDERRPTSWGLVLDRSGSMAGMMREVYNAALHSVKAATREDDAFVMTFNQNVAVVQEFTSDRNQLLKASRKLKADGNTALYDAVALAVDHIRHGRHRKKVLVVVTDGEENASHVRFGELLEKARESEVLIYTVGFFRTYPSTLSVPESPTRMELQHLAEQTGGLAYFPKSMEQCDRVCRDIALKVSQQYSLGYYPKNTTWDGRWREITVAPAQAHSVTVRARKGYFATSQMTSGKVELDH